jgi:hypothetical protein
MLFAGGPDEYNPNQLFICTDWEPNPESIPIELCAQVSHFLMAVKAQIYRGQVQNNLMPFQCQLLLKAETLAQ